MDLREVQTQARGWRAYNFPEQTREQCLMGMVEEMGEISHALLKRDQRIRTADHSAAILDGCGDLIIFMMGLADHEGFDLLDAVNAVWAEVSQRDWVKYPEKGVPE